MLNSVLYYLYNKVADQKLKKYKNKYYTIRHDFLVK